MANRRGIQENTAQRREQFCQEYVNNGYQQKKAYEAVYGCLNPKTSSSSASRLMKDPDVKKRIDELIKEKYEALHINGDRIAMKLADMAFAEKGDDIYNPQIALKAIDMLQKQLGLQKQNLKAELDNKVDIKVNIDEEDKS